MSGASAGVTNVTARLSFRKLQGGVEDEVNEADTTSSATVGNLFRYDAEGGPYISNWDTKPLASSPALWEGSSLLFFDLGDGLQRTVLVSFRNLPSALTGRSKRRHLNSQVAALCCLVKV